MAHRTGGHGSPTWIAQGSLWVAKSSSARIWLIVDALWRRFLATCEVLLNLVWAPRAVGSLPQGLLQLLCNALGIGLIGSLPRSM